MKGPGPTLQRIDGLAPSDVRWWIDADVLVVEFRGQRHSAAHMAACWRAVQDVAEKCRLKKVLAVDLMDDEPLEGADREAFIGLLGLDVFAGRRCAFVARSVDRLGAYEATQLDVQSEGYDVRTFSSRSEAELWVRFPG